MKRKSRQNYNDQEKNFKTKRHQSGLRLHMDDTNSVVSALNNPKRKRNPTMHVKLSSTKRGKFDVENRKRKNTSVKTRTQTQNTVVDHIRMYMLENSLYLTANQFHVYSAINFQYIPLKLFISEYLNTYGTRTEKVNADLYKIASEMKSCNRIPSTSHKTFKSYFNFFGKQNTE